MSKSFGLVAAFHDEGCARRAAKDLARRGVRRRQLHLVRPNGRDPAPVAEMRASRPVKLRDEVTEGVAGSGVGFMTLVQVRGAAFWTTAGLVAGLIVGLAVGTLWAFAVDAEVAPIVRLAIAAACFAVAGAIAGADAGGALNPRTTQVFTRPSAVLDTRSMAGEHDVLLEVDVNDELQAEIARRVLRRNGAERVDAVGAEGEPPALQSGHSRPADPPDFWKGNGHRKG
jgi:hypothetical protein